MIRQAISCDICATEKRQTNHWFVAFEQGGELRVSGWNSRNRLRPGMKHLCGQTCLHKLVDEFMARTIAVRTQPGNTDELVQPLVTGTNASLTSSAAYESPSHVSPDHVSPELDEFESSARLITPPSPAIPKRPVVRLAPELVAVPARPPATPPPAPTSAQVEDSPRYSSRNWRAEAWDRERERELRAVERRPDISPRRRSGS